MPKAIDTSEQYYEQLNIHFQNYKILRTENNENSQLIIKEYLSKKENNLRVELDRMKERVK